MNPTVNPTDTSESLLELIPAPDWDLPGGECGAISEAWADLRELSQDEDPQGASDLEARLVREWALDIAATDKLVELDRNTSIRLAVGGFDAPESDDILAARVEPWQRSVLGRLQDACLWLLDEDDRDTALDREFLADLRRRLHVPEVQPVSGAWVRPEIDDGANDTERDEMLTRLLACKPSHNDGAAPELVAAWLLRGIHRLRPFGDASGRVARAAASYWLLGADLFPLTFRWDDRNSFADALVAEGREGLDALTGVVATAQRRCFLQVVSALGRERPESSDLSDVISVISDQFRFGSTELRRSFAHAVAVATEVFWHAKSRIADLEEDLGNAIEDDSGQRRVFADYAPPDHAERRGWHRKQVIDGVRRQGYFANLRNFSAWNRIGLDTPNGRSEILLSFHAVGQSFRGVIAGGMIFYRKRGGEIYDHQVVSREPFQVNFRDDIPSARRRFDAWLNPAMRTALEVWRRGE